VLPELLRLIQVVMMEIAPTVWKLGMAVIAFLVQHLLFVSTMESVTMDTKFGIQAPVYAKSLQQ